MRVLGDRGELAHQGLEAVDGHAVVSFLGERFGLGLLGAARGSDDRRTSRGRSRLVIVVKENRRHRAPHVPLDVIAEHAQQHVRTDALGFVMMNRTDEQLAGLEATKRALDVRELLVRADDVFGRERVGGYRGP